MGIQISEIVHRKEIELEALKGKTLAIDAMNTLYQFLTTIRQQDGTPLMDSEGKITSHLSGLFYRNIALLEEGIKLVYVFDGIPSELKGQEIEKRKERKEIAKGRYEQAKEVGDISAMRKYSQQTVKIDSEIIRESKEFLEALGIPVVDSLNEGEAEAAYLVKRNLAWASASQDYDSLLYGAPRLIRNLTLSRKKRAPSGIMVDTKIEFVELQNVLDNLQMDRDQLICLGIIVGTDFNPGGVRGIGQMRALEIVRKNKYPVKIFEFLEKSDKYEVNFNWQEIFREFREYKGNNDEEVLEQKVDFDKIKEILLKREFSEERVSNGIARLKDLEEKKKQKGLKDFF
jgi:flap endonuclease-1